MGAKPVIFLDDGGVMNDTRLRGPLYQRLAGEFFASRLGGEPSIWAEANRICIASIFEPDAWHRRAQVALHDYASFERNYWRDWVSNMCQLVGVEAPQDAACIELACQAETSLTSLRDEIPLPNFLQKLSENHQIGGVVDPFP